MVPVTPAKPKPAVTPTVPLPDGTRLRAGDQITARCSITINGEAVASFDEAVTGPKGSVRRYTGKNGAVELRRGVVVAQVRLDVPRASK